MTGEMIILYVGVERDMFNSCILNHDDKVYIVRNRILIKMLILAGIAMLIFFEPFPGLSGEGLSLPW